MHHRITITLQRSSNAVGWQSDRYKDDYDRLCLDINGIQKQRMSWAANVPTVLLPTDDLTPLRQYITQGTVINEITVK